MVQLDSEGCNLELMESDGIRQVLIDSEGLKLHFLTLSELL